MGYILAHAYNTLHLQADGISRTGLLDRPPFDLHRLHELLEIGGRALDLDPVHELELPEKRDRPHADPREVMRYLPDFLHLVPSLMDMLLAQRLSTRERVQSPGLQPPEVEIIREQLLLIS